LISQRICLLDKSIKSFLIKLNITNSALCGIDFKLYDKNEYLINEWRMGIDYKDSYLKEIKIDPEIITRSILIFDAQVCTKNVAVDTTILKIEIMQDFKLSKINLPLRYEINNIPPCNTSRTYELTDTLMFLIKD
jgi:hypothetical protein